MDSTNINLKWIPAISKEDWEKCLKIRTTVFREEQKVPAEFELNHEDVASHFLVELDGAYVGTGRFRLTEDGYKCERIAILVEYRGKGVGSFLCKNLIESIQKTRENEGKLDTPIVLHGLLSAIEFWKKNGFEPHGDIFEEAEKNWYLV